MPELPEVQTIVSDLNKKIKGDKIVDFWTEWKKAIKNISAKEFKKEILGRKILEAQRIGKNIFINLSGNKTIYIHLKMTGHLLVKTRANLQFLISNFQKNSKSKITNPEQENYFNDKVNQYIHHIFYLKDYNLKRKSQHSSSIPVLKKGKGSADYNKTLEFSDLRKFAKIILVDTDEIKNLKEIKSLGIDVLSRSFTFKKFKEILEKKSKNPIGVVLMNQNLIAGIGNIYRNEILFDAKILPMRKISDLKPKEIKTLYNSIKKIIKKAVKYRGTSDSDYRDTNGAPGGFHKFLRVYHHEGEKCKKCGAIIKRAKLGQRSVFYCPKCQK